MYSLQSRLGLWLGLMLVAIFGAHILLMSQFPRYLAEEHVLTRLQHDSDSLYKRLLIQPNLAPALSKDPISPIYSAACSGHYFQVKQGDTYFHSPSLAGKSLAIPSIGSDKNATLHLTGLHQEPLLVWVKKMQKNGEVFTIAIAEDITDIEEDIAERRKIYFVITGITMVLLIVLQRLLIRRAIKPVEQARQELLSIEKGQLEKITQKVPSEIQPLVNELNHLLTVMGKRLERSRNATGNLAHALKTPLSVLNQLLDSPEIKANPELSKEITDISNSIHTSINRELKRARLSGGTVPGQHFAVEDEIKGLVNVMKKVHAQKNLHFDISTPAHKTYQADREDMLEMFGNLLDNACKWSNYCIKLTVADKPGLYFSIEDDGPGIHEKGEDLLTARGSRLDEKMPGHGLGLSIVKEIVEQYGGEIRFDKSPTLGGLRVEIEFPK
ncbi:MAG: sensor histidine kinase [Thiotrichaceae bacterium]